MLSTNYTEILLGIKDVIVTDVQETDFEKHIYLDCVLKTQLCPHCFRETQRVHSYRRQIVKDVSMCGKNTYTIHRNTENHI